VKLNRKKEKLKIINQGYGNIQSAWDNDNCENVSASNFRKNTNVNTPLIRLKKIRKRIYQSLPVMWQVLVTYTT
jgi:hypothetical protein